MGSYSAAVMTLLSDEEERVLLCARYPVLRATCSLGNVVQRFGPGDWTLFVDSALRYTTSVFEISRCVRQPLCVQLILA